MRRFPPEQPREIESVYLPELSPMDLGNLAIDLTESVHRPATNALLSGRHLPGVIARHLRIEDSIDAVRRVQEKVIDGKLAAFALRYSNPDALRSQWVGMSAVMPLRLRKPSFALAGLLPTRVTRRFSLLSEEMRPPGYNVTAWIDAEHSSAGNLADVYNQTVETVTQDGGAAWTIEPGYPNESEAAKAIVMSGLKYDSPPMRYDDFESEDVPPMSTLYSTSRLEA